MKTVELEDSIEERLAGLERQVIPARPGLTRAAVLMPILRATEGPRLLLTRRSQTVGTHRGQISFPGGRMDPDDRDLRHTALREAHEELAIRPQDLRILGELHDRVTVTDFLVTPVVAALDHPYPFRPEEAEIDEVLEVPIAELLYPGAYQVSTMPGREGPVHSYRVAGTTVWGATAGFIHVFLELMADRWGR